MKPVMLDLSDVLRQQASRSEARPARPDMHAQRLELHSRFQACQSVYALNPGDLVAFKAGVGGLKAASRATCAPILWRHLHPQAPADCILVELALRAGQVHTGDCLLAMLDDDASNMIYLVADLCDLRPLSIDELGDLAGATNIGVEP